MKSYAQKLQKTHIQETAVQIDKILYHPINQSVYKQMVLLVSQSVVLYQ